MGTLEFSQGTEETFPMLSAKKFTTVVWDSKGVILIGFLHVSQQN